MCDDDCAACGARHASPIESDDLTFIIEDEDTSFVVLKSRDDDEDHPNYVEVFRCLSKDLARSYIAAEQARWALDLTASAACKSPASG